MFCFVVVLSAFVFLSYTREDALKPIEDALLGNDDDFFDADAVVLTAEEPSISVFVPGGRIVYYVNSYRFEALCDNVLHRRGNHPCSLVRTSLGHTLNNENGRPGGTLAAWLSYSFTKPTRDDHRAVFFVASLPLALRCDARKLVAGSPGGLELLGKERKRRTVVDEPEEPLCVPMGW